MQTQIQEEIIKILPKGIMTIPKKFREKLGFDIEGFARVKEEKGRLIVESVRMLLYPVRSYTDEEINEFIDLDRKETKILRKKKFLR